ncbi:DUF371 domain-containing protein [Methanobrevibacter filiformis]|uniref:DUF371 domain-containing protein n=1 Tax=Methanobrevibacter filiformis TaxID=55758 RepID=A0A166FEL5_9EURY|nr:DUF371 domain-containing protein [Methanobrevibacter filiformis]KZX17596.1 hypothetical protein MBFIL_00820 [Methanobrevibacter filiformis]
MKFKIKAYGHENVSSKHKSTFEITQDSSISAAGDCIIGVGADKNMNNFSNELKNKIANENSKITVKLTTTNAHDEIIGQGHPDLTLNHLTDIVCRKSSYICSRTLMIKADKAAIDLDKQLIEDLKNMGALHMEITVE